MTTIFSEHKEVTETETKTNPLTLKKTSDYVYKQKTAKDKKEPTRMAK